MRRLSTFVALMITIAAIGYGLFRVGGSNLMLLKRVEIAGNHTVSKEELVEISGLKRGLNLFSVSTSKVARLTERIPWIKTARVERIIPSTVRITVIERIPMAIVTAGGASYLVDSDGVILEERAQGFVVIQDLPLVPTQVGAVVMAPSFGESLSVLQGIDRTLRARLESISAPTIDRITLKLKGGPSVLFGADELIEEKNFAIKAIFDEAARDGKKIASIDVRVPKRPAVRMQ